MERGESIAFPLNQVIKGWTEGLQLMSVGDNSPEKLGVSSSQAPSPMATAQPEKLKAAQC